MATYAHYQRTTSTTNRLLAAVIYIPVRLFLEHTCATSWFPLGRLSPGAQNCYGIEHTSEQYQSLST
jgi:hypothetical protein